MYDLAALVVGCYDIKSGKAHNCKKKKRRRRRRKFKRVQLVRLIKDRNTVFGRKQRSKVFNYGMTLIY